MRYRRAIVAADTAFARELCGAAARYYPPLNAIAASEALHALWSKASREALASRIDLQLESLPRDWHDYAVRFEAILDEALNPNVGPR
jgi:hypothetical protein